MGGALFCAMVSSIMAKSGCMASRVSSVKFLSEFPQ